MHSFNDAANGISKIFNSKILGIISAIGAIIASICFRISIGASIALFPSAAYAAAGLSTLISFVTLIISIVAFVLELIGLLNASKDNPTFKTGLYIIIIAIVCSCLTNIFRLGLINLLLRAVSNLSELAVMFIVIKGVSELLPNSDLVAKGNRIIGLALVVVIIGVICNILQFLSLLAGLVSIIGGICQIIYAILYLLFLSDAKKEL